MNPVLILTHNNLELTKKCVESVRGQDIPTQINIFDNDSTDGSREWAEKEIGRIYVDGMRPQIGVSAGWNYSLHNNFDIAGYAHVLVINNDTELSPWTYRELLSYNEPFVTGVSVDHRPIELPPRCPLVMHPDFSCFLIRRDAWERVGPFDERMRHYASDLDWHIRAHRRGLRLLKANVPFFHQRSSTLKNADPRERAEIEAQANSDRAELKRKWGCDAWASSYDAMFDESLFGIDAPQQ